MFRRVGCATTLAISALAVFTFSAAASTTPQISTGGAHTCALEADGTVKCFGLNNYGQLGNATNNGTGNANPTPTAVALGGPAIQVSAGRSQTCVLMADQSVKCFGLNNYGQLGNATNNGTGNANPTPTTVSLGGPAAKVVTGSAHTCVLMADQSVKCFGLNNYGQLGNATNNGTGNANPTPTNVALGGPAVDVVVGEDQAPFGGSSAFACVLMADQSVKCFGLNNYGQLGNATNNGTGNANPTPTNVALGGPAVALAAGDGHTCVLLSDQTVSCFGLNAYGQLGNATNLGTGNANPAPSTVAMGGAAKGITAGDSHTCVLLADNSVQCFGLNDRGQLGNFTNNGTGNPNPAPVSVSLPGSALELSAGGAATCAWIAPGSMYCFGLNNYGQLGSATNNGTGNANPTPALVSGVDLTPAAAPPATPPATGPSAITGKFVAPKWKTKKSGRNLKLSAKLVVDATGMDAAHCSGKAMASIRPRRRAGSMGGSGKPGSTQLFALTYAGGVCSANVTRTMPARFTRKAVKLTISFSLFDSPLLSVPVLQTAPKLG